MNTMQNDRIVIEIRGGNAVGVYSSTPDVTISIVDYDNPSVDESVKAVIVSPRTLGRMIEAAQTIVRDHEKAEGGL